MKTRNVIGAFQSVYCHSQTVCTLASQAYWTSGQLSGLSVRSGGRGFPLATMSVTAVYFHIGNKR